MVDQWVVLLVVELADNLVGSMVECLVVLKAERMVAHWVDE